MSSQQELSSKARSPLLDSVAGCQHDFPRCKVKNFLEEEQPGPKSSECPMTSLEILNPPTEDKKFDPAPEPDQPGLGQELIDTSCICVEDINHRTIHTDTTIPEFIDPSFKGILSGHSNATNYHDFLEIQQGIANIDPEYQINVDPAFADIDERTGHACVYMLVETPGRPVGIRRDAVILWRWMKRYGWWLLYKQVGMRGMGCAADHVQEEDLDGADAKAAL
ncbi:hypothetical protein PRZ48_000174 [Zasmidium cellare]|uniref:Uncharacterized protein n=1 Tax=Zasmidium cellare TaxID=395010 RepID=A0ABR0EXT4_ZASCE|nr:hypothetical protein PRZ48_000174 [Zasmidium cellare]